MIGRRKFFSIFFMEKRIKNCFLQKENKKAIHSFIFKLTAFA